MSTLYTHKEYLDVAKASPLAKPAEDKAAHVAFRPSTELERIEQETDSTHAHDQVRFVRYNEELQDQLAHAAAQRKADWRSLALKKVKR